MKTLKEILGMLAYELANSSDNIKLLSKSKKDEYYNYILGDTSFLLAGLLEILLKKYYNEWDHKKWIDDSLITNTKAENGNLYIDGIMIFGKKDTTEQWTAPFSCKMELLNDEIGFKDFVFLFSDIDRPEITYEYFRKNRNYWDSSIRSWKYIIKSDKILKED